jgi:hypothetical protein
VPKSRAFSIGHFRATISRASMSALSVPHPHANSRGFASFRNPPLHCGFYTCTEVLEVLFLRFIVTRNSSLVTQNVAPLALPRVCIFFPRRKVFRALFEIILSLLSFFFPSFVYTQAFSDEKKTL